MRLLIYQGGKMTTKIEFLITEQIYECKDCGKETAEFSLMGRRNAEGYFVLYCSCGSKNISLKKINF